MPGSDFDRWGIPVSRSLLLLWLVMWETDSGKGYGGLDHHLQNCIFSGYGNLPMCFYGSPECFLVQVATGFAMTFYYRPTVTEAFASVQYIMTEANFGWLIRSVHRWSASMMVLMMILHVFRVYLTGGFKKPRELTWVTGVVLAVLTASFGVTGYSLPWDQVGYWAVKIVTGVPDAIPVIGSPLVELLRGSASVGQSTLTRFYSLHTFVLPLLTAVFMLMHFPMIRKQGISGPL
ncbi:PREDICTED: uncharacterized protein LOC109221656 [Nicotiana attenuata]|uniref:uncharacterized protein LOC109221656 n=1 Tax=Nicotiana attenuata TaxID=49451 RepID=UPI00090529BF|nr:PREDICTED: uncharacterized protein LOC109221656 [Nicotiana attenuata]